MQKLLNWNKKVFISKRKKYINKTGFNITAKLYSLIGKVSLVDGTCLWIKNKNHGHVNSSMVVKSSFLGTDFYVHFPIFLGGAFRYKVVGFSYKKRVICSRLTLSRF